MPNFIGRVIMGASEIENNAKANDTRVRLSYSQAIRLPAEQVLCSLDTTDRGSRGSRAKRWYRWFAAPTAILACPASTPAMRAAAEHALLPCKAHDDCRTLTELGAACVSAA